MLHGVSTRGGLGLIQPEMVQKVASEMARLPINSPVIGLGWSF